MQGTDPIIRTKLRLPFIRPSLVARPRLQARIAEGLCCPLTLVIAPAGFGKTTLVAASIAERGMRTAWLSLDQNDNQGGRFLTYLVAAIHGADDQIGGEAVQLMAGVQQASPEAVLTSLVNDLDTATGEMVLVLDDYQFISNPAVHWNVVFLLEHCPNTLHLLIATRSDPPLPLARLRARSQMVELRAADLRFTSEETAQFLNNVMGLRLDAGDVAVLEERTEGWVAGLQMAALSMRDRKDVRGFIEGFSGTHRHILDYLMQEILDGQRPEIQRFLLYTSILERLTAPLCDAVLAEDGRPEPGRDQDPALGSASPGPSASALEYLERENLFLVSLDDVRTWFRYHHLFADLLRARLHQACPDLVPALHVRASQWLEQQGLYPEAIQHLFAAQENLWAADLIEQYGPARWEEGDPSVMQMLYNVPPEMLQVRPKLSLYQAWFLINQGDIEKAIPLLKALRQHLDGVTADSGLRWMQTWVLLAIAFLSGVGTLPENELLEEIPDSEPILRDAADVLYGMGLGRRGEIDRAAEISLQCLRRQKPSHGSLTIPSLVPYLGINYLLQGRLHATEALCHEYLDPIRGKSFRPIPAAGNMQIVLGSVLYEWNRLEEAEQQVRAGIKANEPWANIMTETYGSLILTDILRAKGDYAGAMQEVEKFEKRLQGDYPPFEFREDIRTLRVRIQLASGDLQSAARWADQVEQSEDFRTYEKYYRFMLARIRLAEGRYAEVQRILAEMPAYLPSQGEAGNRITRKIEINMLRAAAAAGQHRLPEAMQLVETCLSLAETEGYVQIFLTLGQTARELLIAYGRAGDESHKPFAETLLDLFSPSREACPPVSHPGGMVEPLTEREMEVLRLIAVGDTNQEIAAQLIVSPGTVKAHTASIYRKLDVENRTEAVAQARQLGILS